MRGLLRLGNKLCDPDVLQLRTIREGVMLQLNPPIPLDTPKGPAYAHMAIDYSQEHYLLFVCFVNQTGECWIFPNREVKIQKNVSMGIRTPVTPAPCSCAEDDARLQIERI